MKMIKIIFININGCSISQLVLIVLINILLGDLALSSKCDTPLTCFIMEKNVLSDCLKLVSVNSVLSVFSGIDSDKLEDCDLKFNCLRTLSDGYRVEICDPKLSAPIEADDCHLIKQNHELLNDGIYVMLGEYKHTANPQGIYEQVKNWDDIIKTKQVDVPFIKKFQYSLFNINNNCCSIKLHNKIYYFKSTLNDKVWKISYFRDPKCLTHSHHIIDRSLEDNRQGLAEYKNHKRIMRLLNVFTSSLERTNDGVADENFVYGAFIFEVTTQKEESQLINEPPLQYSLNKKLKGYYLMIGDQKQNRIGLGIPTDEDYYDLFKTLRMGNNLLNRGNIYNFMPQEKNVCFKISLSNQIMWFKSEILPSGLDFCLANSEDGCQKQKCFVKQLNDYKNYIVKDIKEFKKVFISSTTIVENAANEDHNYVRLILFNFPD